MPDAADSPETADLPPHRYGARLANEI